MRRSPDSVMEDEPAVVLDTCSLIGYAQSIEARTVHDSLAEEANTTYDSQKQEARTTHDNQRKEGRTADDSQREDGRTADDSLREDGRTADDSQKEEVRTSGDSQREEVRTADDSQREARTADSQREEAQSPDNRLVVNSSTTDNYRAVEVAKAIDDRSDEGASTMTAESACEESGADYSDLGRKSEFVQSLDRHVLRKSLLETKRYNDTDPRKLKELRELVLKMTSHHTSDRPTAQDVVFALDDSNVQVNYH